MSPSFPLRTSREVRAWVLAGGLLLGGPLVAQEAPAPTCAPALTPATTPKPDPAASPAAALSPVSDAPVGADPVAASQPAVEPPWRVVNVFSATILVVERGERRTPLRLIGVAQPPFPAAAEAAHRFVAQLLRGEHVVVRRDDAFPLRDADGHEWAYVYRTPDELFVNAEIVRQGYAPLDDEHEFAEQRLLTRVQQLARNARKGIWNGVPVAPDAPVAAAASEPSSDGPAAGISPPPSSQPAGTPSAPRRAGSRPLAPGTGQSGQSGQPGQTGQTGQTGQPGAKPPPSDTSEMLVYVTKSGQRYHTADCSHARKSGAAISLAEARRRGLSPCTRCRPQP